MYERVEERVSKRECRRGLGSGGRFHTLKPSQHLLTNIDVVRMLTGVQVDLTEIRDD